MEPISPSESGESTQSVSATFHGIRTPSSSMSQSGFDGSLRKPLLCHFQANPAARRASVNSVSRARIASRIAPKSVNMRRSYSPRSGAGGCSPRRSLPKKSTYESDALTRSCDTSAW